MVADPRHRLRHHLHCLHRHPKMCSRATDKDREEQQKNRINRATARSFHSYGRTGNEQGCSSFHIYVLTHTMLFCCAPQPQGTISSASCELPDKVPFELFSNQCRSLRI